MNTPIAEVMWEGPCMPLPITDLSKIHVKQDRLLGLHLKCLESEGQFLLLTQNELGVFWLSMDVLECLSKLNISSFCEVSSSGRCFARYYWDQ